MASPSPTTSTNGDGGEVGQDASTILSPKASGFVPLVNVVDFHHARGPEVEKWFGVEEGRDPAAEWDWGLLPFMALSDGAHAATEDFSYFTLLRPATDGEPATSLFGISCTMQMESSQLLNRPPEVTRSTVQKAVVVIADTPQFFGMLRERLSVVTKAWFAQREFTDTEILRRFQESLAEEKERGQLNDDSGRDQYLGMSLRELVREFRWQTLVLLKCSLLQYKMLFFGSRCERLCMMQFSLISLIPGLLRNLQDCAGPELDSYAASLTQPTSLRTSDRNSLLAYMGLPLQVFGKGSLFGPYTPLQQLDILADFGTKSYIVGSTNSLLLQQKDRYSDILINLDENTVNITSTSLRNACILSHADRRWIDFITQEVNDTWDEANPGRPKTMGYRGSEEFIRLQFEEYLLSMISSVKYHNYLVQNAQNPRAALPHIEGDPSLDFGTEWIDVWKQTENYRLWDSKTDSHLFDIVEPRHPCAGGLTIDDVQRRIQQQVQDLHLDERFAVGREVLGRNLAAGRDRANLVFNKLYADMESMREAQRKRAEEARARSPGPSSPSLGSEGNGFSKSSTSPIDGKSQQNSGTVGASAGAYLGSWTSWANQKRKQAWGGKQSSSSSSNSTSASGGGGWGFGGIRRTKTTDSTVTTGSERSVKDGETPTGASTPTVTSPVSPSPSSNLEGSRFSGPGTTIEKHEHEEGVRPSTQASFSESLLDGVTESEDGTESNPAGSPRKVRGVARQSQVSPGEKAPEHDEAPASGLSAEEKNEPQPDRAEHAKAEESDAGGGSKSDEDDDIKNKKVDGENSDVDEGSSTKSDPTESSKYAEVSGDAQVWADDNDKK